MRRTATLLTLAFALILWTTQFAHAHFAGGGPQPGEVYKEFVFNHDWNNWRVTDPDVDLTQWPDAAEALPNPILRLNVDDLVDATRAEVVIDQWGGHEGTTDKRFRFNGNTWITIPELNALGVPTNPYPGNKYMSEVSHLIPVPLSDLRTGDNTLEGTSGPNSWGWGQWAWYGVVLRVYYTPGTKTHATGEIVSPVSNTYFTDNPTLQVSTSSNVERVDYLAYYDGYDTDGDGVYVDWHRDYNREGWFDPMGIKNHAGTSHGANSSVTWNTSWVPDQAPGQVKLRARIKSTTGYWYVTPDVTKLTFHRSQSVAIYKASGVPQLFLTRDSEPKSCNVYIPTLADATEAILLVRIWNGKQIPLPEEVGVLDFYTRVNGYTTPQYGLDHQYSYDQIPIPVSELKEGNNTISFFSNTYRHGMEILWPGPSLLVRYGTPSETSYTLQVGTVGQGTIDIEPDKPSYSYGETVTLTPLPASGWSFAGWDGVLSSPTNWWKQKWNCRVLMRVNAAGYQRFEKPVEQQLNFSSLLSSLGRNGAFDTNSIRVVEIDSNGQILDAAVPFQFDPNSDFDPDTNATGTLIVLMKGTTASNATRYYHVYFDIAGAGFDPATIPPQVIVTDNQEDAGQMSYRIQTADSTYYYHKNGAGFSSLLDSDGTDWLSYAPTGGAAGSYRGIPNMVYPESYFHPGSPASTSSLVNSGPLKTTIHSITNDGQWECQWEIYPRHATMTLLKAGHPYWFLYEGTPGGVLDANDYVVRSNGSKTGALESWTGDIASAEGEEWAYFTDPNTPGHARSLFVVNHEDDTATDSYWPMDNAMTVFGLGRSGADTYMNRVPAHFSFGLMDETQFSSAAAVIRSAYRSVNITVGQPQLKDGGSLTLVMTEHKSVVGTFLQEGVEQRFLSIVTEGSGSVVLNPPGGVYTPGTVVSLTAVPASGWVFSGWSGALSGNDNPATMTMDANKVVTATFTQLATYSLSVQTVGSGSISLDPQGGTYPEGTVVQLNAVPASGWLFSRWGGALSGNTNPATITMDSHKTVTASFIQPGAALVSDDFNACELDSQTWTFVDPLGDGSYRMKRVGADNARLLLTAPSGTSHDPWDVNPSVRVMQASQDNDFEVEVKFESQPTLGYQAQGIIVEQDAQNWMRFDFYHNGSSLRVFSATTVEGSSLPHIDTPISEGETLFMRVKRVGDQWTQYYSYNGVDWTTSVTFTHSLIVGAVGPFASNFGTGGDIPAHTAAVDYFFNTASPVDPEDGGVVTQWTLNRTVEGEGNIATAPDQATYSCGQQVKLTAAPSPGWIFSNWAGALSGTENPATLTMDSDKTVTATFTMLPGAFSSDDFHTPQLDTGLWTFVNPLEDGSYRITGAGTADARLLLKVPFATSHNPSSASNPSVRVMQAAENKDLEIEVKFESVPTRQYQMQGILVEQDAQNWLKFEFRHNGSEMRIRADATSDGVSRMRLNKVATGGSPLYMRVKRDRNVWTLSYSLNGTEWTTSGKIKQILNVSALGPFAANHSMKGWIAPAFTAKIDYFFNTLQPIVPEDGVE